MGNVIFTFFNDIFMSTLVSLNKLEYVHNTMMQKFVMVRETSELTIR